MAALRVITDRISYLPASDSPLSADVGVVRGEACTWIYDTGSSGEAAQMIEEIRGEKRIVLSHFHADHAGNIGRVSFAALYGGAFTVNKLGVGEAVTAPIYFADGVTLFPIPSTHAKGALGLETEGFAFVGDATYPMQRDGRAAYNAGLLRETIRTLEKLDARRLLLSHDPLFARPKDEILDELKRIYAQRKPNEAYIFLS